MGRPKKHEGRKAVTVYLSEAEYKWMELQAGEVPLATWCRTVILAFSSLKVEVVGSVPIEEQLSRPYEDLLKPKKKVKTCLHGKEKGFNCWQCGGVARIGIED